MQMKTLILKEYTIYYFLKRKRKKNNNNTKQIHGYQYLTYSWEQLQMDKQIPPSRKG